MPLATRLDAPTPPMHFTTQRALRAKLVQWYRRVRRDLPWRRTRDPYAIWVSETMLQQTRVETVIPYYQRFLEALPTVGKLAEAPEGRVLELWSGLGYYRRARMLHAAAKRVARDCAGSIPDDLVGLRTLEGVGAYTAGAVASIAFGRAAAVVDGNVQRVLSRLFAVQEDVKSARGRARIWSLAEQLVPQGDVDPGDWNQALMELGATVCVPREPKCESCPVSEFCRSKELGVAASLPRAATKRPAIAVRRVAIVLVSARAVLLARRVPETLFGGLWEPPSAEGSMAALADRLGVDVRALTRQGEVLHVLTHRRLRVVVARGELPARRRWRLPGPEYDSIEAVSLLALERRAQATLGRKILAVANVARARLPSSVE